MIATLREEFPDLTPPLVHRNAFELLIAVILSAQCTDARVNTITPNLFPKDHPCVPFDLLELGEEKVKKIIFKTGYYNSKTRAIMGCAQALNRGPNQEAEVPSTLEALTALPGVGQKTAQVILSQWFGQAAFPVDTHVHRVCNRLGLAHSGSNRAKTERQVKALIPENEWSALHLRLIFLGRKACTAFRPDCSHCPLKTLCPSAERLGAQLRKSTSDVSKAKPQVQAPPKAMQK